MPTETTIDGKAVDSLKLYGERIDGQGRESLLPELDAEAAGALPRGVPGLLRKVLDAAAPTFSFNDAPQGDGALALVSVTVQERLVFGTVSSTRGVALTSGVLFEVETAPGSGLYARVHEPKHLLGLASTDQDGFSFSVPGGCRWRYTLIGTAAVVALHHRDR